MAAESFVQKSLIDVEEDVSYESEEESESEEVRGAAGRDARCVLWLRWLWLHALHTCSPTPPLPSLVRPIFPAAGGGGGARQEGRPALLVCAQHRSERGGHAGAEREQLLSAAQCCLRCRVPPASHAGLGCRVGCTLLLRRRAESTRLKQSPTLSLSRSPRRRSRAPTSSPRWHSSSAS